MRKIIALIVLASLSSCMSFSDKPLRPVRNSILQQLPQISLDKEFAVSIGGGMFTFLDIVTGNEADLSDLDKVHVAVYTVESGGAKVDFNDLDFEATLLAKDASLHWDTVVRVRKEGEQVWVLMGMDLDRNSLEAVAVFVVDSSELVLIHVDGELTDMIEYAMGPARGHPGVVKSHKS